MILQLLNIERFVSENKLMEVKSFRIPFKAYDEDGLWSETIFGPIGSKTRSERFGYVDLKNTFIHPIVFDIVTTVSDETSKIVREKGRFKVENQRYVEAIDGETGVDFLIRTFNDVKFASFCHSHKKENAEYLDNTSKYILINKFLISPASNRDIDIYNRSSKGKLENEEINDIYTKLIIYIQQLTQVPELDAVTNRRIQLQLIAISDHFKRKKLTGKKGLFRGNMLRKSMDYSSRLVLTNDPDIKIGEIGLPWHTLVAVFEPFMVYHLFKKEENLEIRMALQQYTKSEEFDYNDFSKFVKDIVANPDVVPNNIKSGMITVLNQFLPDQIVMCKRDPVIQRKSWFAATPIITEGRVAFVNSMDLGPLGGDCVKGNIITYTKTENGEYIQHIESIDTFYTNHDLSLIEKRIRNGVEIYDFLINDEVYSIGMNEVTGDLQYSKIQKWSIHNNIDLVNMIINNTTVTISENNSCYVYSKSQKAFNKVSVNDVIKNQDDLMFIKGSGLYSNHKHSSEFIPFIKNTDIVDNEIGWFLGMWLGDGYISLTKQEPNLVALTKMNQEIGNDWCDIASSFTSGIFKNITTFKPEYGLGENSLIQDVETATRLQAKRWGFRNKEIRNFILNNFGYYCEHKTIPSWVNDCNNEFIFGLVAGLIDSDASIDENSRKFELYSNSKTMLANLADILRFRFDISSVLKTKKIKFNYLGITISENNIDFWDEIASYVKNNDKYQKLSNAIDSITSSKTSYYYPNVVCKYLNSKNSKKLFNKKLMSTSIIPFKLFKDDVKNPLELNLFKLQDEKHLKFISAEKVFFEDYNNTDVVNIEIDDIIIHSTEDKIAYDLTMEDENVRSFLHSSMILQCNSDGDTVAILPVFTNEAKEEAKTKMNPAVNKSKWKDLSSYNGTMYMPSLDSISAIYTATAS
jgi:hypothetical protein